MSEVRISTFLCEVITKNYQEPKILPLDVNHRRDDESKSENAGKPKQHSAGVNRISTCFVQTAQDQTRNLFDRKKRRS